MISKKQLVELLVDAGWENAGTFDEAKLTKLAAAIPTKLKEEDVAAAYKPYYRALVKDGKVDFGNGVPVAAVPPGPTDVSKMERGDLLTLIDVKGLVCPGAKKMAVSALRKKVAGLLEKQAEAKAKEAPAPEPEPEAEAPKAVKGGQKNKPIKEVAVKETLKFAKEKKEPLPKVPRDAFGCKLDSLSAKVNKCISKGWKSEQDIILEAGVTKDQALGRLYYASTKGEIERRKVIEYRLVSKAAAKDETD